MVGVVAVVVVVVVGLEVADSPDIAGTVVRLVVG